MAAASPRTRKPDFSRPVTTLADRTTIPFIYKNTKPSYLVGLNYKPNDDILVYAKYSTAFVSGGSVGGVPFEAETAQSFEAGIKADLLDRKLRTSLAVYHADYDNYQSAQGALTFADYITQVTGDPNRRGSFGNPCCHVWRRQSHGVRI